MGIARLRRHQQFNRLSDKLIASVAELLLDLRIDQRDPAITFGYQQRFEASFYRAAKSKLGVLSER